MPSEGHLESRGCGINLIRFVGADKYSTRVSKICPELTLFRAFSHRREKRGILEGPAQAHNGQELTESIGFKVHCKNIVLQRTALLLYQKENQNDKSRIIRTSW